jgi:tRNA(Ile)-lysidine synthase
MGRISTRSGSRARNSKVDKVQDKRKPPLSRFARRLFAEWRRLALPPRATRIIIAVSGGADSTALALACEELQRARRFALEFIVAHLNHKLRGAESEADARWVEALARKIGFEALISQADVNAVAQTMRDNLEQAARRARYEFLRRAAEAKGAHIILTAHTLDDQAETFLLRLIRGSGAEGLGAMRTISKVPSSKSQVSSQEIADCLHSIADLRLLTQTSDLGLGTWDSSLTPNSKLQTPDSDSEIILVRPLLNWARRAMTEDYCRARGVEFCVDAMNEDVNFARVRVRRALLPMLEEFNPRIVETLTRTAEILRADEDALTAEAKKAFLESQVPSHKTSDCGLGESPKSQVSGRKSSEETRVSRSSESGIQNPELNQQSASGKRTSADLRFETSDLGLSVEALRKMLPAVRVRVLRLWLARARGDLRRIERAHLRAVESLIFGARGGRVAELPGGGKVERRGGRLIFRANKN